MALQVAVAMPALVVVSIAEEVALLADHLYRVDLVESSFPPVILVDSAAAAAAVSQPSVWGQMALTQHRIPMAVAVVVIVEVAQVVDQLLQLPEEPIPEPITAVAVAVAVAVSLRNRPHPSLAKLSQMHIQVQPLAM